MAKTAVKVSSKPKARRLKGRYSEMDLKMTGPMPEWHDMDELQDNEHLKRWNEGKRFYYYHHDVKELRPFIVELFGKDWDKKKHKAFANLKDSQVPINLGSMCKMVLDGAKWWPESKVYADRKIAELLELGASTLVEEVVVADAPKKVINIQDRLQEIKEETIGDIEAYEDDFIRTGKIPTISVLSYLRNKNTPQQIVPAISEFYTERLAFMMEVKAGKDPQLKEGYAHLKKKDVDAWIKWYNDIVTDLDAYKRVKVAARKPRQRKPQSPEKLARKMKFQKDIPDLNITSVQPKEIVGATQVWVYNTKTRKLGRYVASSMDQVLSVKGSTVLGWDPKLSVSKTLRKPSEQLAEFMKSGKVQLRTFLDKIRATEVKLNGRTNDQTIILRVDK